MPSAKTNVVVRGRPNLCRRRPDAGLKLMEIKRCARRGHRITLLNETQFWRLAANRRDGRKELVKNATLYGGRRAAAKTASKAEPATRASFAGTLALEDVWVYKESTSRTAEYGILADSSHDLRVSEGGTDCAYVKETCRPTSSG